MKKTSQSRMRGSSPKEAKLVREEITRATTASSASACELKLAMDAWADLLALEA